jgi:hypothetical protein
MSTLLDRDQLLPAKHRPERSALLDLLAGGTIPDFSAIDPLVFLQLTPEKLYPFLHWQLRTAGAAVPALVGEKLLAAFRHNQLLQLRRMADLKGITEALGKASIAHLVLKGPVLAKSVYPTPAARTMIDVDVLVHGEMLREAIAVLQAAGWLIPPEFAGQKMEAGDAPPMIHRDSGSAVLELHTLLDSAPDDEAGLAEAWSSARLVDLGNSLSVSTLGAEEFFAHVAAHVSRHHRFEEELRSMLDVALLLRAETSSFDWPRLLKHWEGRKIRGWIELTVWLSHLLLRSPLPEAFKERVPGEEPLRLAAEQLWAVKRSRLPASWLFLLAGTGRAPVHAAAHASWKPLIEARGFSGLRSRGKKLAQRAGRFVRGVTQGSLRPRNVSAEVKLLRGREKLFELVEDSAEKQS